MLIFGRVEKISQLLELFLEQDLISRLPELNLQR